MDLTIKLENSTLNIRVAIIMQTANGYVLQKNKNGWHFFLGGRIKLGESSLQAAIRETEEETGLKIQDFKFVSILENFFKADGAFKDDVVQEICFIYTTPTVDKINPDFGLLEIKKEDLVDLDIRPEIIKKLILENKLGEVSHHVT